jgi:hypothetical protein
LTLSPAECLPPACCPATHVKGLTAGKLTCLEDEPDTADGPGAQWVFSRCYSTRVGHTSMGWEVAEQASEGGG